MKKRRYIYLFIAFLLVVTASTTPSSKDYTNYLHKEHGLNCEAISDKCIHTKLDMESDAVHSLPFFMTATTTIFGDENNKIRVLGIFNHFFVIENNLKAQ